jgi:penicillin-binding protein 2
VIAAGASKPRLSWVGGILLCLALLVLGRTLYLQMGGPTRWSRKARQQQTANLSEPPKRGRLLDRQGRVLVDHVPRFLLHRTADKPGLPAPAELGRLLDPAALTRLLAGRPVAVENADLPALSELVSRSKGLTLQEISTRSYPHGSLACHALGYVREEEVPGALDGQLKTIGVDGLEAVYDKRLQGQQGIRTELVSATGVPLGLISEVPPQDGPDLVTSLDLDLQRSAEAALDQALARLQGRPERRSTAPAVALLMDAASGEMLVMACRPCFDPSLFQKGDERVGKLLTDAEAPLMNRAIAGLYPPASTFKLVTAATVLEKHPQWASESFYCTGSRTIGATVFNCFVRSGHGALSFEEAIAVSCDSVFYDLATRMPVEELLGTARRLGFGRPTGIDLPGESAGALPDPVALKKQGHPWYAGDSANLGIGQGYMLATPLQVLTATAHLVGNPKLKPRLLAVPGHPPPPPAPPAALQPLWVGTRGAVAYGTASGVDVEGLEVAGKTGTAEAPVTKQNPRGLNHTWFVAWAPADHPRVVALAFFEGSGGYGGEVAGPVVSRMLQAWKENQEKEKSLQKDAGGKKDSRASSL